jgi:hypothetical protein
MSRSSLENQANAVPWWVRLMVLLGAFLMATGAVVSLRHPAMLVSPNDQITGAVRIYAGYFASRNLALAIMLVLLLILHARRSLGNLMVLVALVQALDACIDCAEGRWMIVPGVAVFGLVFLMGAAQLSGYPFWRAEGWK